MSAPIEIKIPDGASEVTLKTANKYCDKDIRVSSHFRMVKGTKYEIVKGSPDKIRFTLSEKPKMLIWRATEATQEALLSLANAEKNTSKYYTFGGVVNFVTDFDIASTGQESNKNSMAVNFQYYNATLGALPAGKEAQQEYADGLVSAGGLNLQSEFDNGDGTTTPAEYEWTAYYWGESATNYPVTGDIIGDIDSALDGILAIQKELTGGETE